MSSVNRSAVTWTYDDPSEWSNHYPCANGLCQSPINIITKDTIHESYLSLQFSSKYNTDETFIMFNNGQQIVATLPYCTGTNLTSNEFYMTGSDLTGKYYLVNFHLHWGPVNELGSEHQIDGKPFTAEAHFVHRNFDSGQVAVLAVLFTADNSNQEQDDEWEKYANIASQLIQTNGEISCKFNLSRLMQLHDNTFFRYSGSLTTPPCTEGIIWTVFPKMIPITEHSLNLLRNNIARKTYRPIQSTNGRTIFRNHL